MTRPFNQIINGVTTGFFISLILLLNNYNPVIINAMFATIPIFIAISCIIYTEIMDGWGMLPLLDLALDGRFGTIRLFVIDFSVVLIFIALSIFLMSGSNFKLHWLINIVNNTTTLLIIILIAESIFRRISLSILSVASVWMLYSIAYFLNTKNTSNNCYSIFGYSGTMDCFNELFVFPKLLLFLAILFITKSSILSRLRYSRSI